MDRNKNKPDLVFSSLPDILTVKDLQMALRIGKSTAYKLIQDGEIQHFVLENPLEFTNNLLLHT